MTIETRALVLAYRSEPVIRGVDLTIREGEFVALIGPNGAGKSALLRGMARLLRPRSGEVLLDGRSIWSLPAREVARRVGWLSSSTETPPEITVRQLVERARFPYRHWFGGSPEDGKAVAWAVQACEMTALVDRELTQLSSGERQRAWIAAALARQPSVLLLDEPTAFLDVQHALEVLDLLAALNREQGLTILLALHDLIEAGRHCARVVVLDRGRVIADGTPEDVLRAETIGPAFGVDLHVVPDPLTGRPISIPHLPR